MEARKPAWGRVSFSVTVDEDRVRRDLSLIEAEAHEPAGSALAAAVRETLQAIERDNKGSPEDSSLAWSTPVTRRVSDDGTLLVEFSVTREPWPHETRKLLQALEGHGFAASPEDVQVTRFDLSAFGSEPKPRG